MGHKPYVPTRLPARSRLTLLPRSPTVPLRTIRTGFLADRLWLMRVPGFRPPAGRLPHMPN